MTVRNRKPEGYVYLAVLFSALVVSAAVAASLAASTQDVRAQVDRINRKAALRLAEAELHRQAARLSDDPDWRSNHTNGAYSSWTDVTGIASTSGEVAAMRYQVSDADGDLADDPHDFVNLTAHARVGDSETAVTVTLEPGYRGLDLLGYGVTAADDIELENGALLVSGLPIQAGDDCKTTSWGLAVTERLVVGDVLTTFLRGDLESGSVTLPPHDVVDRYVQNGTEIQVWSLPWVNGKRTLQNLVLTAGSNPFGTTDEDGIYWMDAGGAIVRIQNCRLGCVLAIRNALRVEIAGAVVWQCPAEPEAILAADAPLIISSIEPVLDETTLLTNFNPDTSPYRGGFPNDTTVDRFDTELRGLIYTTGDVAIGSMTDGSPITITGALIGRDVRFYDGFRVHALPHLLDSPPLGFTDPIPMRFVHGSFRRVPTP